MLMIIDPRTAHIVKRHNIHKDIQRDKEGKIILYEKLMINLSKIQCLHISHMIRNIT